MLHSVRLTAHLSTNHTVRVAARLMALCAVASTVLVVSAGPAAAQAGSTATISEIYYNAPGTNEGMEFVEITNRTGATVDLGGYEIDGGIGYTFVAPTLLAPGAHLVLAASSVDFEAKFGFAPDGDYSRELSNQSEVLVLFDDAGAVVDRVQYFDTAPWPVTADGDGDSLQLIDTSIDNDQAAPWRAGPPTPAAENRPNSSVVFSPERGFFNSSVSVTLSPTVPGATIQYALNGGTWRTYTGPLNMADNGGVRGLSARTVLGGVTSSTQTHSYVFAPDRGTPVIVKWNNGMQSVDGDAWTGSFEFIAPPSVPLPSVGANAGWRANQAGINAGDSEKVYFRSEYGDSTLKADLFSDVAIDGHELVPEIDQLALRNKQGDATHVKQCISHDALASLGLLSPHCRFVHLYEDGSLSGVRQMQERPETGYMEAYTDHDKSLWNSTNWTTDNLLGDVKAAAEQSTLDAVRQVANLDHFIGYSLVDFLAADGDGWWKKNWRLTGPIDGSAANGDDFAWHFFVWDEDDTWGSSSWRPSTTNQWPRQPYEGPEFLFVELMDLLEFRYLWADAAECAYRNGGPLTQEVMYSRVVERVNELAQLGQTNAAFLTTMSTWMDKRSTWLFTQFVNDGMYPQASPVALSPAGGALLPGQPVQVTVPAGRQIWYTLDGSDPRNPNGSLNPRAIQLVGNTLPLHAGSHQVLVRSYDPSNSDVFQRWSAACPVNFERQIASDAVVINELAYNPADHGEIGDPARVDGDLFEFIELYNPTAAPIAMTGWQFADGVDYTFPTGTLLGGGDYMVLANDPTRFAQRYGFAPDGVYQGNLSNAGEALRLVNGQGTIIDNVVFDDVDPWPVDADGTGPSLVLIDTSANNYLPGSWRASQTEHGSPGAANRLFELGDVDTDGDVDAADVNALLDAITRDTVSALVESVADVDSDRTVGLRDAQMLAQQIN